MFFQLFSGQLLPLSFLMVKLSYLSLCFLEILFYESQLNTALFLLCSYFVVFSIVYKTFLFQRNILYKNFFITWANLILRITRLHEIINLRLTLSRYNDGLKQFLNKATTIFEETKRVRKYLGFLLYF